MLSGFDNRERRMNVGKTLFAQVMEFVMWKTFERIIERHKGDAGVRTADRASGIICDQRIMLNGFYSAENYPNICAAFASTTPKRARRWCF
jgi:hypothetical protein